VAWTAGCHPLASFSTAPEIFTPVPAVEAPLPKAQGSRSGHSTAFSFLVPRSPGRNIQANANSLTSWCVVQSVDFGIGKYDYGIMTMIGKLGMKKMAAGSFKIRCLAVMDEVQAKRETVVITKHGKPVAKLVPADKNTDDIYNFLVGKGAIAGDIVSPAISDKEWGEFK
jgi:prevent-host-death family protein